MNARGRKSLQTIILVLVGYETHLETQDQWCVRAGTHRQDVSVPFCEDGTCSEALLDRNH